MSTFKHLLRQRWQHETRKNYTLMQARAGPNQPPTVTVSEVMSDVVATWEINASEYEHLEW